MYFYNLVYWVTVNGCGGWGHILIYQKRSVIAGVHFVLNNWREIYIYFFIQTICMYWTTYFAETILAQMPLKIKMSIRAQLIVKKKTKKKKTTKKEKERKSNFLNQFSSYVINKIKPYCKDVWPVVSQVVRALDCISLDIGFKSCITEII